MIYLVYAISITMLVGYPMVPGSRRYRDIEPTMCIQTCTETHVKRTESCKAKDSWDPKTRTLELQNGWWVGLCSSLKLWKYKLQNINCLPSKGKKKIPSNNPHQSHEKLTFGCGFDLAKAASVISSGLRGETIGWKCFPLLGDMEKFSGGSDFFSGVGCQT